MTQQLRHSRIVFSLCLLLQVPLAWAGDREAACGLEFTVQAAYGSLHHAQQGFDLLTPCNSSLQDECNYGYAPEQKSGPVI